MGLDRRPRRGEAGLELGGRVLRNQQNPGDDVVAVPIDPGLPLGKYTIQYLSSITIGVMPSPSLSNPTPVPEVTPMVGRKLVQEIRSVDSTRTIVPGPLETYI